MGSHDNLHIFYRLISQGSAYIQKKSKISRSSLRPSNFVLEPKKFVLQVEDIRSKRATR